MTRSIFWLVPALLVALFVACMVTGQSLSYDGAMNMQVARSLAAGDGYARTYGDRAAFPVEVQSNAPFLLITAAAIRIGGMEPWILQLENGLYFAAAWLLFGLLLSFTLGHQRGDPLPAAVLAIMMVFTVNSEVLGFRGWGEIPALAFWAAALLIVAVGRLNTKHIVACVTVGLCLAAAVLVKRYMLLALIITYAVLLVAPRRRRASLLALATTAATLLSWEGILLFGLGSELYTANLRSLWSGVATRAIDDSPRYSLDWLSHRLETAQTNFHQWDLPAEWVFFVFLLVGLFIFLHFRQILLRGTRTSWSSDSVLLIFALSAFAYMSWWFLLTPMHQMRVRRVYWWALLGAALTCVWLLRAARSMAGPTAHRMRLPVVLIPAIYLVGGPMALPTLYPDREREMMRLAQLAQEHSQGRVIFTGAGYPSSPGFGLHLDSWSGDLHTWTFTDLAQLYPFLLVTDRYTERRVWPLFAEHFDFEILEKSGLGRIRRVTGYRAVTAQEIDQALDTSERKIIFLRVPQDASRRQHFPLQSRAHCVVRDGVDTVRLRLKSFDGIGIRTSRKNFQSWKPAPAGMIRVTGPCTNEEYRLAPNDSVEVYVDFRKCPTPGPHLLTLETDFTLWKRRLAAERGYALHLLSAQATP